jgi:anti-sigma factor RsiW
MTCVDFEGLILDRIDGRPAPELEAVVGDHVGGCEPCRAFLATQTELDRALFEAPRPSLSPQFSSRVLARVDGAEPLDAAEPGPRVGFAWDLAGLAGVAAAAAFGIAYFFPMATVGAPWIAAGAVVCGGVWLTLAEPPTPSA